MQRWRVGRLWPFMEESDDGEFVRAEDAELARKEQAREWFGRGFDASAEGFNGEYMSRSKRGLTVAQRIDELFEEDWAAEAKP